VRGPVVLRASAHGRGDGRRGPLGAVHALSVDGMMFIASLNMLVCAERAAAPAGSPGPRSCWAAPRHWPPTSPRGAHLDRPHRRCVEPGVSNPVLRAADAAAPLPGTGAHRGGSDDVAEGEWCAPLLASHRPGRGVTPGERHSRMDEADLLGFWSHEMLYLGSVQDHWLYFGQRREGAYAYLRPGTVRGASSPGGSTMPVLRPVRCASSPAT
jgi:hypothetical protein